MKVTIFTDGAARGNPGPGGWASILIFKAGKIKMPNKELGMKNEEWVHELGGREKHTTNNRMELTAVIKALVFVLKLKPESRQLSATLHTDSAYVLNGATKWLSGWKTNDWKTKAKKPVLNQDLWQEFARVSEGMDIKWKLLPGHSGLPANERCDEIATSFADKKEPKLYSGVLRNYGIDTSVTESALSEAQSKHKLRSKRKNTGSAYSYVSMIKGKIVVHKTWAECEKRVKGVSNTRFKKATSSAEEKEIISQWTSFSKS